MRTYTTGEHTLEAVFEHILKVDSKQTPVFLMTITRSFFATFLLSITTLVAFAAPDTGDQAPEFNLQASDGKTYSLSEHLGQKGVVIAFFPKAFTGG
jgi:hypothetical protein